MKFLIDVQLPFRLKKMLSETGYDVIHTDDLSDKERTSDKIIRQVSLSENRIVITKDSDFLDSYHISGIPQKLLLVTTGNIRNTELLELFSKNMNLICELFLSCNLVEIGNNQITGYGE